MTSHSGFFWLFVSGSSVLGVLSFCLSLARLYFLRRNTYHCTPPRLRLLSLSRAVWPILTYFFGYVLFVLPARTRAWPPLLIVTIFYFRYGFLPGYSFRACCTLHPDLLCDPHCQRLSFFPLGPCFFVASSLVFISLCTVLEMILMSASNHHCRYLMTLKDTIAVAKTSDSW